MPLTIIPFLPISLKTRNKSNKNQIHKSWQTKNYLLDELVELLHADWARVRDLLSSNGKSLNLDILLLELLLGQVGILVLDLVTQNPVDLLEIPP